jgi:hypothetical protein
MMGVPTEKLVAPDREEDWRLALGREGVVGRAWEVIVFELGRAFCGVPW